MRENKGKQTEKQAPARVREGLDTSDRKEVHLTGGPSAKTATPSALGHTTTPFDSESLPTGGAGRADGPPVPGPTPFAPGPEGDGTKQGEGRVIVRRGPLMFKSTQSIVDCPGSDDCDPQRAVVFRCRDCGHAVMVKQGCRSRKCGECYRESRQRRAKQAREKLDPFRSGFQTMIFTIPVQLRDMAADPKVMKAWRNETWKLIEVWMRRRVDAPESFRAGAGEWTHPEGDENPDSWSPHLNFLVPLVLVDHLEGEMVRIPYFVQKDHLALLKRAYRRVLGKVFNVTIEGNINLWVAFRVKDKGRHKYTKEFAYQYYPRTFPSWSPKKGPLARVNWTRWFGILTNRGKVRGWTATKAILGLQGEWDKDKAEEVAEGWVMTCEECDGLMERVIRTSVADAEAYLRGIEMRKKSSAEARAG